MGYESCFVHDCNRHDGIGRTGMEVNAGVLGNSTAAEAYGIIIATNGLSGAPYFTVPGTVKSYIQVQVTGGADIAAAPANGFVFNSGGGVNAIQTGGSLITVNGSTTAGFGSTSKL